MGNWSSILLRPFGKECRKHLKNFHPRDRKGAFHWLINCLQVQDYPQDYRLGGNSLTFQSCIFISEGWGLIKASQKALGNASTPSVAEQSCQAMGHMLWWQWLEKGVWGVGGRSRRTTLLQQQCPKQSNSTPTAQLTISLESPLLANTEEMTIRLLDTFAFIKKAKLYF